MRLVPGTLQKRVKVSYSDSERGGHRPTRTVSAASDETFSASITLFLAAEKKKRTIQQSDHKERKKHYRLVSVTRAGTQTDLIYMNFEKKK